MIIMITFQAKTVLGLPANQIVVLASGIFILPFFLFSALAGQVADKFEKGKITRIIKWTEVGIMVLATLGFLTEHFSFLLIVLFLMGLHSTFFGPIKYSILPQHLDAKEMIGGNAVIEAGTFLAILLGTICGGVLIQGTSGPLMVSFGLLLCSLIGLVASYQIPNAQAVDPELELELNPIQPTFKMIRFAKEKKSVYFSILGISWFWFFGAALLSLFAPLCKDVLQGSESLVTTFLALFSVGIGFGSLLCEKLSTSRWGGHLVTVGSFGISIFTILLFVLIQIQAVDGLLLADLFFLALCGGLFIVPLYTMMQSRSEISKRSRVIAANNILNAFFMVISSLFLSALLYFHVTIPLIIFILGLLNLVITAWSRSSSFRSAVT